jgi:hypothetical protein
MARVEFSRRVAESMLFKDDNCLREQSAVFGALEKVPAYRISYGSDPAEAVPLVLGMLAEIGGNAVMNGT